MGGRKKDTAPEGYVTVREATELLGLSETAIRYRIFKGTLEAMDEATDGGEPRYYIPREAIDRELGRTSEVATTADIQNAESALEERVDANAELIERVAGQIIEAISGVGGEVSTQRREVVEALDRVSRELSALNRLLEMQAKDAKKDREALRVYLEQRTASDAHEASQTEVKRVPWWRRLFGLTVG